jgi:arylsulfatase A-like enzyme
VPRCPHPRFRGKSQHGLRGDAIVEFDWSVGEVLKALDAAKVADNTLVIVTSDNGGVMDDGYVDGTGNDTSGHKCNGALRGYKGGLFEGGHRVPMLARWPGKTPAGQVSNELICHVDLMATFAAILDVPLPKGAAPDSFNQLPSLVAAKPGTAVRDHLVHQSNGVKNRALRMGSWKYIPPGPNTARNPGDPGGMLFDLANDPSETKNLAKADPAKVKEMAAKLAALGDAEQTRK